MAFSRYSRLCISSMKLSLQNSTNISTSAGIFGVPQLASANGFLELETQVRRQCNDLVKEAYSSNRQRKMVQIFDDLSDSICRVADLAECMRNLHPDPKFASYAENCVANISELVESFNTDYKLYRRLKDNLTDGDLIDQRVAKMFVDDFEASGVHLSDAQRKRFVAVSAEIFQLSAEFIRLSQNDSNVTLETQADAAGPSFDYSQWANSADATTRRLGYTMHYARSQIREDVLRRLLVQRQELAEITGFKTYAHRALRGSLLETPENVESFLLTLIKRLTPLAENDLTILRKFSETGTVAAWDAPYYTHLAKRSALGETVLKANNYFNLNTMLNGINDIMKALFNVSMERSKATPGELWHADVDKLILHDENSNELGTIYCDWFDRPNKMVSDSHFTVRCARQLPNGSYQLPIVVLAFRHQKQHKTRSQHSHLSINEVENVLHEFGHALHSILGRTRYQHVSGTRCSTDFAEIPSNLMEHYANSNQTLPLFAKHYQKALSLSPGDADTLRRSSKLFASLDLIKQSVYALFDLRLHSTDFSSPGGAVSTCDLFDQLTGEHWPLISVPGTAWHQRFSHLVHYGSKYNAYLVAAASANEIWRSCFQADPLNNLVGQRWRQVLAYGGERPPADLIELMLNKKPTIDELADAVVNSINVV